MSGKKGEENIIFSNYGNLAAADILEHVNDGIYITDHEANTIYINHRYEMVSGLRRADVIGQNMKDMVSNGDSPAGPQMISPEMYRRFACQSERAMLCEAHRHGLPYLLHICGKTDRILSAMTEIGLDAVELDYKTSIEAIHHNFAASTTLFGTVDPSGVIALGSPEDIRREILTIAERYRDNPRLVLGAGCAIPPMAPRENILAFVKTVHELQN